MFECGFSYGWRRGELLNMQVRQVDLLNGTIMLDPGSTKTRKGRVVVPCATFVVLGTPLAQKQAFLGFYFTIGRDRHCEGTAATGRYTVEVTVCYAGCAREV